MLDRQAATLIVAVATLVVTALLFILIPKGLFPTQDTGLIQGVTEASQSTSFGGMAALQQRLADRLLKDPDVQSITSFIGVDGSNTTLNDGRFLIQLKPFGHRTGNQNKIIANLKREAAQIPGRRRSICCRSRT